MYIYACIHTYIYIYIYTHIHTYIQHYIIYIYIYIGRCALRGRAAAPGGPTQAVSCCTPHLPTNTVDFAGFDSSIILI